MCDIQVPFKIHLKLELENIGAAEVLHLLNASRTNKTEHTCIVRVAQRRASAVLSIKVL